MTIFKAQSSKETGHLAGFLLQAALKQPGMEVTGQNSENKEAISPQSVKDPMQLIPLNEGLALLEKHIGNSNGLQREAFSFAFSAQCSPEQQASPLQLLFLSSNTVWEGLKYLEKFFALLMGQASMEIQDRTDTHIRVCLDTLTIEDETHRRWILELLISHLFDWLHQLCEGDIAKPNVQIPVEQPGFLTHYENIWQANVTTNTNQCIVEIPIHCLEKSKFSTHPAICRVLLNEVENQFRKLIRNASLADSLAQAFDSGSLNLNAEQNEIARLYNISARTLNRYLKKENTSLKQIATRSRMTIAKRLLSETDIAIQDIAIQLKLSGRRALDRLFISSEGISPARYRQLNRSESSSENN